MKRFRLRLTSMLWLVAVAAAFLGGVRYGEHRARPLWKRVTVYSADGRTVLHVPSFNVHSSDGIAEFEKFLAELRREKSRYAITTSAGPFGP